MSAQGVWAPWFYLLRHQRNAFHLDDDVSCTRGEGDAIGGWKQRHVFGGDELFIKTQAFSDFLKSAGTV